MPVSESRKTDERLERATKSDPSRFDGAKWFAYSGIPVVFGAAISVNDFSQMWKMPNGGGSEVLLAVAKVVLFSELVIWTIRWIIATHFELELWIRWLENPIEPKMAYAGLATLSVFLGLCLAFPHRILVLSAFLSVCLLVGYWTQWLCNDHLARATHRTRRGGVSTHVEMVLQAMEFYWLKRAQLARVTTMMFFTLVAFAFALAGAFQTGWTGRLLYLVAYAILILDILVAEVVIAGWRHRRDQEIDRIVAMNQGVDASS